MKSLMVFVIVTLQIINAVPVRRNPKDHIMNKDDNSKLENPVASETRRENQVTNTTPVSPRSTESEDVLKKMTNREPRKNVTSLPILRTERLARTRTSLDGLNTPTQLEDVKQKYVELVKKFSERKINPDVVPYAAFAGDNCATGFMRFGEICIDGDA